MGLEEGDYLVVGRWLGSSSLGLYTRARKLMGAPASLLGGMLDDVLFPAMARVQDDLPRLGLAYRRGVSLVALTMLPLSALLMVLAPEVIAVALGPQWLGAVVPFQILAVGLLLRTSYKMSDSLARDSSRRGFLARVGGALLALTAGTLSPGAGEHAQR